MPSHHVLRDHFRFSAVLLAGHDTTADIIDTRDGDMIIRVGSSFVQEADGLTIQSHELTLETNVANLGDVVLAVSPIILEEESDRCGGIPMSAVQREFEDIGAGYGLRDLDGLGRGELGGSGEVEIIAVLEQLDGLRSSGSWCSVQEERVKFDLAGEAGVLDQLLPLETMRGNKAGFRFL